MDDDKETRRESILLIEQIKNELLDQISLGETCVKILRKEKKLSEADGIANKVKERRIIVAALKRLEKRLQKIDLTDEDKIDVVEEIVNIRTSMKNLSDAEKRN